MVATWKVLLLAVAMLLAACGAMKARGFDRNTACNVYVADFQSTEMDRCRPSDVPLGHGQAAEFVRRAKLVDARSLHDHHNHAPCFVEGTLKYRSSRE